MRGEREKKREEEENGPACRREELKGEGKGRKGKRKEILELCREGKGVAVRGKRYRRGREREVKVGRHKGEGEGKGRCRGGRAPRKRGKG